MPRRSTCCLLIVAALTSACGDDDTPPLASPAAACPPPGRAVGDDCVAPGVQDDGCPAGTLAVGGACVAPGVRAEQCAAGFEHDGDAACRPVLPAEPCPPGQMAVPGDSACHAVMDCGSGKWGNIPVDSTTEYVDAAFVGVSDGSEQSPWTTISEAVSAAPNGGIIAVTDGSYAEQIEILDKSVAVWGRCPERVAVVVPSSELLGIAIIRATGTELHGLSVSAPNACVGASGSEDVLLQNMWLHDCLRRGATIEDPLGTTSATLRDSLIESNRQLGVLSGSADVTVEGCHIRNTLPTNVDDGAGIGGQINPDTLGAARITVRGSHLEANVAAGIIGNGADIVVEGSVIRDTVANTAYELGHGVIVVPDFPLHIAGSGAISGSWLEHNVRYGIYMGGSPVTVDSTTVIDTVETAAGERGIGVGLAAYPSFPNVGSISSSLIERSQLLAVLVLGAQATLEGVLVRDTRPARNWGAGRGVTVQLDPETLLPGSATVKGSRIEQSHEAGMFVVGADVVAEGLLIAATAAGEDGAWGDGLLTARSFDGVPTTVSLTASRVEQSERGGASSYGSRLQLSATAFSCQDFDLFAETFGGTEAELVDSGGNGCGCPEATAECQQTTAGGVPPPPVGGLE